MPKIGLALGGGGAKGLAHIGVLYALEQLDIQADIITGASMGGIIGALYAAGLSAARIEECIRATGLTIFAAREPSPLGLIGRNKVVRWLESVVGDVTFEQLPRKLAVMAVDLESEEEVILDSGRLIDALLATSAFPGLFAPVLRDGRYLIDGGALNNVPFDVARRLGADYVIASHVTAHRDALFQKPHLASNLAESFLQQIMARSRTLTIWAVVERAIAIMQDGHVRDKLAQCPPDLMLCPAVGHVGLFDLHHLDECLEAGIAAARAHEAELMDLRARATGATGSW